MRKKLYIETSVWNQLEHDDRPEWRNTAERFLKAVGTGYYELYISNIVIDEILATPDLDRQKKLVGHINRIQPANLELDEEAAELTKQYLDSHFAGNPSQRVYRDCAHVAIATINGIKHIVSFNYKHLVNDRKMDGFNSVNIRNGYDHIIDISTPHRFLADGEQE